MKGNTNRMKEKTDRVTFDNEEGFTGALLFRRFQSQSIDSKAHYEKKCLCVHEPVAKSLISTSSCAEHIRINTTTAKLSQNQQKVTTQMNESDLAVHSDVYLAVMNNFVIEKYRVKDRYCIAEIHRNLCSHCRFESLLSKPRKDKEDGVSSKPEGSFSLPHLSAQRSKKKIIVKMPRTDEIYVEDISRPVLQYTHKNK